MIAIVAGYFNDHPEMKQGVMKAYYAWHGGHFRTTDLPVHNFLSSQRWAKCMWCSRTREEVRWDELPASCDCRPQEIKSIQEVIFEETKKYQLLLDRSEKTTVSYFKHHVMSGKALASLKQTHGINPEDACDIMDVSFTELKMDYDAENELHSNKGKAAFKPTPIVVKL
jgi:hypothetical protein